ncbi:hypothetical protein BLNAU_9231 [Blattamonas nauphoetae]|uniref:Uncharacterized protein n=1 Tax=Blattamonas nauphoetae TaxID=2049346 RepID=A0ABQ9XWP9_9EUKA|nr:hypothetical protein BLNAU_9231 [Blattamonas nauphoetae]
MNLQRESETTFCDLSDQFLQACTNSPAQERTMHSAASCLACRSSIPSSKRGGNTVRLAGTLCMSSVTVTLKCHGTISKCISTCRQRKVERSERNPTSLGRLSAT